jgi:hypothetical protein
MSKGMQNLRAHRPPPRHCEARSAVAIQCARKGASRPLDCHGPTALAMTRLRVSAQGLRSRTGGVPKGRDFDNPRRQPGGRWPQDHIAPTGRYVVQPHQHMHRFRQFRYHLVFRTREQRMFFPMMPLRVTPRWGCPGWDCPPRPPADAGGYQNCVPSENAA